MGLQSHTLPGCRQKGHIDYLCKFKGAAVIVAVLLTMMMGAVSPVITLLLVWYGHLTIAGVLAAFCIFTVVCPIAENGSALVCRLYLLAAGWFERGTTLHVEDETIASMAENNGSMWCIHPHGTSIGFGFSLNGAVRFKADYPEAYVHEAVRNAVDPEKRPDRLAKVSGVQAPVLFKIPFVSMLLRLFGCATPASKEGFQSLLAKRADFGILPGGMEEVALYKYQREIVYIKQRKGFIKYALQYGYLLHLGYTFGENGAYRNVELGRFGMWCQKNLGFIAPIFWGPRLWCPLLPHDDIWIETVIGSSFQLPRIAHPTNEDIDRWHAVYMSKLKLLFDTHKARFGYADRELEML